MVDSSNYTRRRGCSIPLSLHSGLQESSLAAEKKKSAWKKPHTSIKKNCANLLKRWNPCSRHHTHEKSYMIITACCWWLWSLNLQERKEFFGTCTFGGHFLEKMSLNPSSFPVRMVVSSITFSRGKKHRAKSRSPLRSCNPTCSCIEPSDGLRFIVGLPNLEHDIHLHLYNFTCNSFQKRIFL